MVWGDMLTMREGYIKLPELASNLRISVRRLQQIIKENQEQLQGQIIRMGHKGTWISPEGHSYISSVVAEGKVFDLQVENALLSQKNESLLMEINKLKLTNGFYDLELIDALLLAMIRVRTTIIIDSNISKSKYWSEIISPLVMEQLIEQEEKQMKSEEETNS